MEYTAERDASLTINGERAVLLRAPSSSAPAPSFTSATILPGRGFNTWSLRAHLPGRGETDVILSPSREDTLRLFNDDTKFGGASYKRGGALLIPYANRIRGRADGDSVVTTIGGRDPGVPARVIRLPGNKRGKQPGAELCTMHGLIHKSPVTEVELAGGAFEARAHARLQAGDYGVGWPSRTELQFRAVLKATTFTLEVEAKNIGTEPTLVGIGWHPYFAIPSGDRAQARVEIPARRHVRVNNADEVFPTGAFEDTPGTAYDYTMGRTLTGHLDDCFFDFARPQVSLHDPASNYRLDVRAASDQIKAFQVYSPVDQAFVAIEPQFNFADPYGSEWPQSFDTGMATLEPGQTTKYAVVVEISALGGLAENLNQSLNPASGT